MGHASASLSRRRFALGLAGIAATLAVPRAAPARSRDRIAPDQPIARKFNVFLGKDPIGTHAFSVAPTGVTGDWDVAVDIDMLVDLGLFGEIIYRHTSREAWRGGRLVRLESRTDDDGDLHGVTGRAAGGSFRMHGPDGWFEAPGHLLTSNSAWSETMCQQSEIIDATAGRRIGLVATLDGTTGTAGLQAARIYQVTSPMIAGSFGYDEGGLWMHSRLVRRGHKIDYVLAG